MTNLRETGTPGCAFRRKALAMASLLVPCLLGLLTTSGSSAQPELEILPEHFHLRPGEQIHYTVCERSEDRSSKPRCPNAKFAISDPKIVRIIDPKGIFQAVAPGLTELVVQTPASQRRITLAVAGAAQSPMPAVPYSAVHELVAKELLFVGHANLDGFDHTAVAKPAIDHLVQEAKKNGWPVVYFVSKEYPNWYTADRRPDYAIVTEGQEHRIRVESQRVIFTGGDFMFCTLRNVQMTLHGMLQNSATRIDFVFPAQAIWVEDLWVPGDKRPYPAPMVLLATLFARRANDAQRYDQVVVPFLDRVITQYPVLGYPPDPPAPPLSDLLKGWSVVVRFGERCERVYRRGDANKTVLFEFQGV